MDKFLDIVPIISLSIATLISFGVCIKMLTAKKRRKQKLRRQQRRMKMKAQQRQGTKIEIYDVLDEMDEVSSTKTKSKQDISRTVG